MDKSQEYYLQGAMWHKAMSHGANRRARRMFHEAIRLNPGFARAHGYLSYAVLIAYLHDWKDPKVTEDNEVSLDKVMDYAREAYKDKSDYDNHWSWAAANTFNRDHAEGLKAYDEALRLAKGGQAIAENISTLNVEKADALMFRGGKQGIADAIRLVQAEVNSPYRRKTHLWTLGWAYYELGFYEPDKQKEHAAESLKALLQFRNPDALIKRNIIASYGMLGWTDAAKKVAKELTPLLPTGYSVTAAEQKWPFGDAAEARLKTWQDYLINAGLPK